MNQISIDKLTVLGNEYRDKLQGLLQNSIYIDGKRVNTTGGKYRYDYYCVDGSFLQTNEHKEVRLVFNPNKACMEEIRKILSTIRDPYLTRMDIAIDYYIDLSSFNIIDDKSRKSIVYYGRKKDVETIYIGSMESCCKYRAYNKAKKSKTTGNHWRIEVQQKFKKHDENYFRDYFSDIRLVPKINKDVSNIANFQQKAIIHFLITNPNEWVSIRSANTRKKYKEIIENLSVPCNIEQPSEVYKKWRDTLESQLEELFSICYRSEWDIVNKSLRTQKQLIEAHDKFEKSLAI